MDTPGISGKNILAIRIQSYQQLKWNVNLNPGAPAIYNTHDKINHGAFFVLYERLFTPG